MMDARAPTSPPYFDPVALRAELTAIFRDHDEDAQSARNPIAARLKQLVKDARNDARLQLESDGNGRRCAAGLSKFQDELVHLIYDYTVAHVYRLSNPTSSERVAVIATGGYGRGLLAPGSDIDLLFLLPSKQTPWGESVVESVLYMLWDLGFKVGHATRTIDQCIKLALADMTIRTSLLDARLIFGDAGLFAELMQRFSRDVIPGTAKEFIAAKMAERDQRHTRSGSSRYKVEPNIKDGKGGLRDLHTLHWLAMYLYGTGPGTGALPPDIFTHAEHATFRQCEDFLWTVRCHLHFMTGRPEERLSFEYQRAMAERLNYRDRSGVRAVERFMKHYFLIAKDVGDLTTILCSALEIRQVKEQPRFASLLNPLGWRARRKVRSTTVFRVDNGRLNVADRDVFKRDPVNLIRFFSQAEQTKTFFHPEALRLLRSSERLVDGPLRDDPEANRIFLDLLASGDNPEDTLRRMNETGVLGRFVPEFGKVVSMMQFNMYHHYTVDEHLLRTIGELSGSSVARSPRNCHSRPGFSSHSRTVGRSM